jgi:hypothetical protein
MNELFRMNEYGDIWQGPTLFDQEGSTVTSCKNCGMTITLKPPNGKLFLGGWVGNDGWGTMCGDNGASHEPANTDTLDGYYADTPLGLIG